MSFPRRDDPHSKSLPKLLASLSLGFLILSGCKHIAKPNGQVKHDEGSFAHSDYEGQWQVIDDETYAAFEPHAADAFPATNKMAQRLQAWSDAIHQRVIAVDPKLASAPKPLIKLIRSNEKNGYVFAASVCGDTPVTVLPRNANAVGLPPTITNQRFKTGVAGSEDDCLKVHKSIHDQKLFLEWSLRDQKGCSVAIKDNSLVLSSECALLANDLPFLYKGYAGSSTAQIVTLYSGLVKDIPEDEVVGILAHELGHFYRAHAATNDTSPEYRYFYRSEQDNPKSKPVAVAEGDPLLEMVKEIEIYKYIDSAKIEGQKIHSIFYSMFYNISMNNGFETSGCLGDNEDCVKPCKTFKANLEADYDKHTINLPGSINSTEVAKQAYKQYEAEAKACTSQLKADIYKERMLSIIKDSLNNIEPLKLPEVGEKQDLYSYLLSATDMITPIFDRLMAKSKALSQKASEAGLGWYTTEQEADEIATELLLHLGIDPHTVVRSNIRALKIANPDEGAWCESQFKAGFPKPIELGGLADEHHGSCYRAYNSYRELKAHASYFQGMKSKTRPVIQPETTWAEALTSI